MWWGAPEPANPGNVLHLTRIPPNENTMSNLFAYYSKYGSIESIWCGGTEAIVIFYDKNSAMEAYKDPKSFLDNRFILVNFHASPGKTDANLEGMVNQKIIETNKLKLKGHREDGTKLRSSDDGNERRNDRDRHRQSEGKIGHAGRK